MTSSATSTPAAARFRVTDTRTGASQIDANVPLAEMFGYATDLRSKTQGRGNYSMEPSHYAELPKTMAEEIVSVPEQGLISKEIDVNFQKFFLYFPASVV